MCGTNYVLRLGSEGGSMCMAECMSECCYHTCCRDHAAGSALRALQAAADAHLFSSAVQRVWGCT